MSTSSIKSEIGKFHVGVVQRWQRNEQSCFSTVLVAVAVVFAKVP